MQISGFEESQRKVRHLLRHKLDHLDLPPFSVVENPIF